MRKTFQTFRVVADYALVINQNSAKRTTCHAVAIKQNEVISTLSAIRHFRPHAFIADWMTWLTAWHCIVELRKALNAFCGRRGLTFSTVILTLKALILIIE